MNLNIFWVPFFVIIDAFNLNRLFSFLYFTNPNTNISISVWWKSPEVLILLLLGIAGLISLLHLGSPVNVANSINNYVGSWISKEILSLGFLVLSVLILFLIRWLFPTSNLLINIMLLLTAFFGVLFIYSMSRIYLIETVPSWNIWFTPVSFFSTVILFALLSLFFVKLQGMDVWANMISFKSVILLLIIFLMIQIVFNAFHQFNISGMGGGGIENVSFTKGLYFGLFIARTILLFVLVISLIYVYLNFSKINSVSIFGISFLLIVVLQEFIGRFMFYQSYFRIGV